MGPVGFEGRATATLCYCGETGCCECRCRWQNTFTKIFKSESLILIKRSLLEAKPGTAAPIVPESSKARVLDRMMALVQEENPNGPIIHSASEKQVHRNWFPVHGLSIWVGILR